MKAIRAPARVAQWQSRGLPQPPLERLETTIDAAGNIYLANANAKRVLKITPAGQATTLVQSPYFVWVDATWIDHAGNLWIPVPQMNRTAGFQPGVKTVQLPV